MQNTIAQIGQDVNMYTASDVQAIKQEAIESAQKAAVEFLADWNARTGGNEYGEPMYCGFASTKIYGVKGNTKLGKAFKQAGLEKDYSGAYSIWNPSGHGGQSMDVKEVGAQACADVFRKYGFTAYMESRAD
tara:strand:+ start:28 stop:423 length:396 start_codon:yes stop_codon:yes gene_type:complete